MKVMDIKPRPRTHLGISQSYLAYAADNLRILLGKKITVKSALTCKGKGRRECERLGAHSWFNHAMDSYYDYQGNESNLPAGAKGDPRYDG